MKVLVVVSGNHERVAPFVLEQTEALRLGGCEVGLFCVTGHGVFGYLQNLKPLKAAIHRFQPDVVHAHYGDILRDGDVQRDDRHRQSGARQALGRDPARVLSRAGRLCG